MTDMVVLWMFPRASIECGPAHLANNASGAATDEYWRVSRLSPGELMRYTSSSAKRRLERSGRWPATHCVVPSAQYCSLASTSYTAGLFRSANAGATELATLASASSDEPRPNPASFPILMRVDTDVQPPLLIRPQPASKPSKRRGPHVGRGCGQHLDPVAAWWRGAMPRWVRKRTGAGAYEWGADEPQPGRPVAPAGGPPWPRSAAAGGLAAAARLH